MLRRILACSETDSWYWLGFQFKPETFVCMSQDRAKISFEFCLYFMLLLVYLEAVAITPSSPPLKKGAYASCGRRVAYTSGP